ncbi:MAG: hypothetical protein MZW92_04525 [Comamonadaceae bacterium]|nr:hypothetical protein [Comamonadaceae bacterium]
MRRAGCSRRRRLFGAGGAAARHRSAGAPCRIAATAHDAHRPDRPLHRPPTLPDAHRQVPRAARELGEGATSEVFLRPRRVPRAATWRSSACAPAGAADSRESALPAALLRRRGGAGRPAAAPERGADPRRGGRRRRRRTW